MKADEAYRGVNSKCESAKSEQGPASNVGSDAPGKNFGHSSASSGGVSGSIPVHDAFGEGNSGGSKKKMSY